MIDNTVDEGSAEPRGIFGSLKSMMTNVLAILQTRLEIISAEIQEEKERMGELILLAVVSVFCLGMGILLLNFFIVVAFWESYRLSTLGILIVFYLGVGLAVAYVARKKTKTKSKLFSTTLMELSKDRDHLGR